jgi:hypothetical protein
VEAWKDVEAVTVESEVLVRCNTCGQVLTRVPLWEKLQDSGFPRRIQSLASGHRSSCLRAKKGA